MDNGPQLHVRLGVRQNLPIDGDACVRRVLDLWSDEQTHCAAVHCATAAVPHVRDVQQHTRRGVGLLL